ncbi:MAG: glycosyltransferase [Candidatus Moduliflexus flocculans]|nr:glycosyltransferase [Candidatus Moduliflexus flocculans]
MKVVIAGGGTGGHLFPGIAVAEEFRATGGADSVVFVGTNHGIEARIVPREGYAFHRVRAEGIVGKSFVRKARASLLFLLSLSDARRILKSLEPDIVIGVGGYASVGTVLAAHALGIPCMIIEQNAVPGLANRFLGRWADAVAVTYQESISFSPMKRRFSQATLSGAVCCGKTARRPMRSFPWTGRSSRSSSSGKLRRTAHQ